jgi:hypothetical protein
MNNAKSHICIIQLFHNVEAAVSANYLVNYCFPYREQLCIFTIENQSFDIQMRPINWANAPILSYVAKLVVQFAELLHLVDKSNFDQRAKSPSCYALW